MPTQTARAERMLSADDRPPALAFVVNGLSGSDDTAAHIGMLRRLMDADGRPYCLETIDRGQALARAVARAAAWAAANGGAIVASGGDGTLNAVAQAALKAGCPMGVVPQGTFNYFARAHGIPTEPAAALRQLLASRPAPVQFGLVNERIFLVSASLGLYPRLLQDREAFKRQHGRTRLNAVLSALGTLLREHRYWTLELDLGGKEWVVRTATLVVGNNVLQLEQVGLPQSAAVARGALAGVMVAPIGRLAMLGLALRGALGRLGDAAGVTDFAFRRMTVRPAAGPPVRRIRVAIDGEVLELHTPLTFQVGPAPLMLLRPPHPAAP